MKIDVECHEMSVLQGAEYILENPKLLAILAETNGSGVAYGVNDEDLVNLLATYGFKANGYSTMERKLTKPRGGNTVFVRDDVAVMNRIREAKRFEINQAFV